MPDESALQHPPQTLQPMQLPPLVDPHEPPIVDLHRHPTPISLPAELINGLLVPGAVRGCLNGIQDIRKVGAEGFLVFLGQAMCICRGEFGKGMEKLVGAAVGRVHLHELGHVFDAIWVRDDVRIAVIRKDLIGDGFVGFFVQ